ncbi:MFS general substrate transporter [Athelia psychrophila]|uniref:MFS general substrate transporter n=1 Tax=Athelia psychrophila TaxID=1759441 RepID=A0A166CU30_9AGAM|nr:MFS general substrate transporter [Fibularhizoctonia sp. CBS 109695]
MDAYSGGAPAEPTVERVTAPPKEHGDSNVVTWDGPNDLTNPKNWSIKYKYLLSGLCCLCTLNVGFASSAPTSAIGFIAKDFGVAPEVSDLITSLFLVGFIAGPTVWGPGSELVGRQIIYRVSMVCYTLVILGQALAPNIEVMLITRFFAGFFASAPLTNSGGVLVDIWDPATRGHAVAIFAACVALGPVCGPFVGGFVSTSHLGWRWVFWIVMIVSWVVTVAVGCIMPETFAPVLLQRKAIKMRAEKPVENAEVYAEHEKHDWSFKGVVNRTFLRPFIMLYKEPILVLTTLYLSFVYGLLYAMFDAVPIVFYELRGFSLGKTGLVFISFGLGAIGGSAINFYYSLQYAKLIPRWKGFPPPEERLYGAMIAGPALIVGAFWFGWTGNYPQISWIWPALALILIGLAVSLIFVSLLAYLVDCYLMYSASALAANVMCRSAIAAAFPLFAVQMYKALGVNWANTVVGCIAIVLTPVPFLFFKYGARIRAGCTFSPCIDLRIAKQLEIEDREAEEREKGKASEAEV